MASLLLPGLICNESVWAAQIAALADRGFVAVHGYSRCASLRAMAERVLEQAPDQFNLCGHSMGARVALEVYRLAPSRVRRLALLDTGVHGVKAGEREKRYALRDVGREHGMAALVERWLPPMVAPHRHADTSLMTPLRDMAVGEGLAAFEAQTEALLGRSSATELLTRITVPTLVATGELDVWSPPEQHTAMANAIADSRYVIFEGAGHFAPAEAPDQVNQALIEWLDM